MRFHVAAIEQPGQPVGDRHLDRRLHVVAQPLGVALLLDLRPHARQHLVLVDRAHQIVVDADFQPAHQPRVVVGFGNRKDRHIAGALERADLAAQPQAVEILQPERHDDQVVVALGGAEQRFVRISLDVDDVFGRQRRRRCARRTIARSSTMQDAAIAAGFGDRLALGALDADLPRGHRAHAQFVGHHFQPRQRAHARDQRNIGHRLGEEIVGAGFQPAHAVGRLVERGDHHHRDVMREPDWT